MVSAAHQQSRIAELVLALFVLIGGQANVVQAQIAGSILATSLFGLGLAIIVGGATRERQHFKPERAGLLSTLLILVVIALLLPAAFDLTERTSGHTVRLGVSDEDVKHKRRQLPGSRRIGYYA